MGDLCFRTLLRHTDVIGERRAAEDAQVDVDDVVPRDAPPRRDPPRRLDLVRVPLPVTERQRVHREPLAHGEREARGGVEAATQEHDGGACVSSHL